MDPPHSWSLPERFSGCHQLLAAGDPAKGSSQGPTQSWQDDWTCTISSEVGPDIFEKDLSYFLWGNSCKELQEEFCKDFSGVIPVCNLGYLQWVHLLW